MTRTAMALVLYTAGTMAYAAESQWQLTVYVRTSAVVRSPVLIQAEALAGKMFGAIGISLEWRTRPSSGESSQPPVFVELAAGMPQTHSPRALASALPYEGSHLTVFLDRIEATQYPGLVLAHVLAHEITHLLQGVERHSATGVMKARWTAEDYAAMRMGTLPFTPEDVDLIYRGLAVRPRIVAAAACRCSPPTDN